jgi:hypothetical protein
MSKRDRNERSNQARPAATEAPQSAPATPAVTAPVAAPAEVESAPVLAPSEQASTPASPVRPSLDEILAARADRKSVEICLLSGSGPELVAGLVVYGEPRVHVIERVAECGWSHLEALASNPTVRVRIVEVC